MMILLVLLLFYLRSLPLMVGQIGSVIDEIFVVVVDVVIVVVDPTNLPLKLSLDWVRNS